MPHRLRALVLLALLALSCLPAWADHQPLAVEGRLAAPAPLDEPLPLRGDWGFVWSRYVDPDWRELPARAFAPVPAPWNGVRADGKPEGENGFGSYVLQLDCPAAQRLAIEAVGQRTASRLYVNGTLVASHGRLGTSADTTAAAIHNRVPLSDEFACPLRLTLHVANHEHRAGGFVRPLLAGSADALARDREGRVALHAGLLAAYLFTALVALIFYAVRRRERTPLVYGLFCVAAALYADLIGERLLLRALPAQVPWGGYMQAEYLSWIGAMGLFLLTLHGLFPAEVRRSVVSGVLALLGAAVLAVLLLPPGVYSRLVVPGQAIAVLVSAYLAVRLLRAPRADAFDARVLLLGLAAVVVVLAVDLLLIDTARPDRKFAPFGFALFLLSPAVVIARRLSHALNAEERNRTLEENARLREDVERMSRHDLKTPLTSILGATRLLAEGGRLDSGQRELAGVVQRASLRMLEMVNLSLGLYRMEQGTYVLAPVPVDLQDVVRRVLVDLHGYAQDRGAALHLRGSGRDAVHVRGEELLCYSIVGNLVKNAIEAAGSGATVTLELHRGDPVALSVANPGRVPPEVQHRFFEKYATHGKSGGTGLGTYSARLLARVQHGDLAMRTGADGTTLTLTLPRAELAAPVAGSDAPTARLATDWLADGRPRTALVVDDDEFNRLVHRRFLPTPPFEVDTAANGLQAEESMTRRWPQFLLLDMEMPLRNGLDTVRWVREREANGSRPRCHVLMLSGNDEPSVAERALAAGADRFLPKPTTREAVLGALRELEAGETGGSADAAQQATTEASFDAGGDVADVVRVNPEWVSYFPKFIRNQRDNLDTMANALSAGDRKHLAFIAHRAFGGLSAMGLSWAAGETRFIEHQALHAPADDLQRRIVALREYLGRVRCEAA